MTSLAERFWPKVNKYGPVHSKLRTRCWLWTAATTNEGYGKIQAYGKLVLATHASWFLRYGKWPKDCVLHKCDTPGCIRPEHVFEGDKADNNRDMLLKGRASGGSLKGVSNPRAKLTKRAVRAIRRMHGTGKVTQQSLAVKYNVGHAQIHRIVSGEHWSNV